MIAVNRFLIAFVSIMDKRHKMSYAKQKNLRAKKIKKFQLIVVDLSIDDFFRYFPFIYHLQS